MNISEDQELYAGRKYENRVQDIVSITLYFIATF